MNNPMEDPNEIMSKDFLTREDAAELLKTDEGRRMFMAYLMRERIAAELGALFVIHDIPLPSKEVQEQMCAVMWEWVMRKPVWDVLDQALLAQGNAKQYAFKVPGAMFHDERDTMGSC
ncbi:MAG: hypothetical protein WC654_00740 [Patescibacteria group bacterium]